MLASRRDTLVDCNSAASRRAGELWSLWDMLKFNAAAFYEAMENLGTLTGFVMTFTEFTKQLGNTKAGEQLIDSDFAKIAQKELESLHAEVTILGNHLTALSVRRLIAAMQKEEKPSQRQFGDAIREISSRLKDELDLVCTLAISQERAKYFEPAEPLFGQLINDRLPLAVPDIEDAGKCIAVNQGTAAVFHLMRVTEAALKGLAQLLGIPYAPSWESYIKQINDRIAAKHKTKGIKWKRDEAFYRDLAGDLQTIKIAWRNPTMHIVRRYSAEEAEEILRAVRGFLIRLAPKLPLPPTENDLLSVASVAQSSSKSDRTGD
jgi:hypothetical protein